MYTSGLRTTDSAEALQRKHEPVFPNRKTDARSRRPAQCFRKPVVTSAAKDRILRAQRSVGEFKRSLL